MNKIKYIVYIIFLVGELIVVGMVKGVACLGRLVLNKDFGGLWLLLGLFVLNFL